MKTDLQRTRDALIASVQSGVRTARQAEAIWQNGHDGKLPPLDTTVTPRRSSASAGTGRQTTIGTFDFHHLIASAPGRDAPISSPPAAPAPVSIPRTLAQRILQAGAASRGENAPEMHADHIANRRISRKVDDPKALGERILAAAAKVGNL